MDYDSDEELQQLIRARAEKEKKAVSTKPTPQPTPAMASNQKDSNEGAPVKDETGSGAPADEPERPKRKGPAPILESHTGLQLVARKTSSDDLDRLCGGRRVVGVSGLGTMDEATIEGADFVLIGVLVVKNSDRASSSGGKYSLWTLSDLAGHSVDLYLFGDAAGSGQSVQAGMVVSVVCPKALPRRGSGAARHFSVTNGYQIFQIGYASDFASCSYKVKHGYACGRAFNRKQGLFCPEHVRLHAEASRQAHSSSPWLLPSNLTTAPPKRGPDNGQSTYTVASSVLSGGMTAAGIKRPTPSNTKPDNKLLKKLKREHDVIRVLKDGPSASTVAEYKAKANPPAPAPMLTRKPVSSASNRFQSNLISHRRPTPLSTNSSSRTPNPALSSRTLQPRPSGSGSTGGARPATTTSSGTSSTTSSGSGSQTAAKPAISTSTPTTTSSSGSKDGPPSSRPTYMPNRPPQPLPSAPSTALQPSKPPPPSSSSSQPQSSSQKVSPPSSAPSRPPIPIVSSKPRSYGSRHGPPSVTVKNNVGEAIVLPLTSLAKREPLADLMEPHKRIWLDEEERAKTMSGSVHKPQPSVLLTKGPDTLVQQAHLARVEARRLAAQAEAEEARQQKNEANKAAVLRAMQTAGHRNRNPAQYRPASSSLTSFRDLAPSSLKPSTNGTSSLKPASSLKSASTSGLSMLRPLGGPIAKKGPTPGPSVVAPRGVSMISAELTGGGQASQPPKQLGGLSAEEREELMNAKSRHHDTHKEELKRQLESVLGRMEEREAKIDKMRTVTSKRVDAYHCAQCNEYREGFNPVCGREGHTQTKTTVVKRFFACRMCDHPTSVLHFNLPKQACTKCGESSWVKGSLAGNANKGGDGPNRLVLAISDWTRPEDVARLYAN